MWEINMGGQLFTALLSFLSGAAACVFYDFFRGVRKVWRLSFFKVFISDILFWVITAFFTFLLLFTRTGGTMRGYIFLCGLAGFCVFRIFISNLTLKLFVLILSALKKIYGFLCLLSRKISLKICDILPSGKNIIAAIKKCLKNAYMLMYNKLNIKKEYAPYENKA